MRILVVVDMQNDFIDMALGTKEAVAIVPKVKEKIQEYVKNGDEIMLLPKSGTPVNCTYHFAAPLILSDADHVRLPDGTKLPIP